jgi:tetratricopeptide (TPR) repeat protein
MFIDPVFALIGVIGLILIIVFLRRFIHLGKIEKIEKMIEAKQYSKAIPILKNMIAKNDENILAHYYLGLSYYNLKNYEWSMPEFKKVIRNPKLGKEVDELEVREKLAKIYLNYNQLEEAQKEFLFMTQLDPKNYKNYFEIARILHKQGYLDAAFSYYQKTVERNPKFGEAFYYMGLIAYDKKRYNDSLSLFNDAIKYDPSLNKAHYYIGMIYYANKHYEKALSEFAYSERDSEMRQKTVLQKGKVYIEMGQLDRATHLLEGHLKTVSTESSVTLAMRYNLANVYEAKRNLIGAIEQWEKIVKIKPSYLDVQDKLAEYEDLRMDDRVKDLMVASRESFQIICRNVVETLGYQIIKEELLHDERMEFLAVEPGSKWRNTRKIRVYIILMRRSNKVDDKEIAYMIDNMKVNNTMKAICACISGFTEGAKQYSESRPIDLWDKEKFSKILEKAEVFSKERIRNKLSGGK